ncbi:hypothetical protein [Massilia sp. Root418]|uniref:hypothetical protein n=1 Tax=Massilia sp. Root418 TaxID=1736532 RepID=UPI0012F6CC37|nr:hypothetical protein [Massilia sp. Root418]
MTKAKLGLVLFITSLFWVFAGWSACAYWQQKMRKTQSVMALVTANDAARIGNYDAAVEYAAYAFAYDNDFPIAEMQIKEFTAKRASSKCDGNLSGTKEAKR